MKKKEYIKPYSSIMTICLEPLLTNSGNTASGYIVDQNGNPVEFGDVPYAGEDEGDGEEEAGAKWL